jgi:hypothetical protein
MDVTIQILNGLNYILVLILVAMGLVTMASSSSWALILWS